MPGLEFSLPPDRPSGTFDVCVVLEGVASETTVSCPANRTILVTGEPSPQKHYDRGFLAQFALVVTTQERIAARQGGPLVLLENPALPWWTGIDATTRTQRLGLPEILSHQRKLRRASLICSRKRNTAGHRLRLAFVEAVQRRLGGVIDIFGRDHRPIADKAEALLDYRFHIAVENCQERHYWTEKLADPILAGCTVLYHGCPDIHEYFGADAVIPIDITRHDVIDRIAAIISAGDAHDPPGAACEAARQQLVGKHNLFARIPAWVAQLPAGDRARIQTVIRPEPAGLRRRLRRLLDWSLHGG